MSGLWGTVCIALSVVLNAFFAGVETGFTSARAVRLLHRGRRGDRGAALAARMIARKEQVVVGAVVGNNVAVVAGTSVATLVFVQWFGANGETLAAVVMSALNIVFGEILPKTVYRAHPERAVSLSAHLFRAFSWLLWPVQWTALVLGRGLLWLLGFRDDRQRVVYSRERLLRVFAMSHESAELDQQQDRLLRQFIHNSHLSVSSVMTPRESVSSVASGARVRDVIELVRRTGHSRVPVEVEDGGLDGLVLFRDLMHMGAEEDLGPVIRETVRVTERMELDEAIAALTDERASLAIVVDDRGETRGIVSLEDLLEPLVGDILDEHDFPTEEEVHIGTF